MKLSPDFYLLTDPKTRQKSVSFTLLITTFVINVVAQGLLIFGVVPQTGQLMELFMTCVALYFGRKLNVGGKEFSSDQAGDIVNKIDSVIKKENS